MLRILHSWTQFVKKLFYYDDFTKWKIFRQRIIRKLFNENQILFLIMSWIKMFKAQFHIVIQDSNWFFNFNDDVFRKEGVKESQIFTLRTFQRINFSLKFLHILRFILSINLNNDVFRKERVKESQIFTL